MICSTAEFDIPVQLQLADGVRERVQAQIARVNKGFIVLATSSALEQGRTLDLMYLDRPIRCEIAYCNRKAEGIFRVGARMLEGAEGCLRAERRIKFEVPARLKMSGNSIPISVRVIDVSSSGLGVKLEHALEVGTLAYVEMEHGIAFGEIRHCSAMQGGYRAGLFVEEFISRTEGAPNPWAARSETGRSTSFSVGRALKSALLPGRNF